MKKYLSLTALSVALLGLTSCLKDKNLVLDPEKSPAVVEFSTITDNPAGAHAGYTMYSRAFDIVDTPTPSTLSVNYTGGSAASTDVNVGLNVNAAAVDAYNKDAGTTFEVMPTDLYTMPTSVTIKSGERKATVDLTFKTSDARFLTHSYVLPIRIASTTSGNISGNYGTILLSINAKNKYDGVYSVTGTMVDAASAANVGAYPRDMYLVTQSANSNAEYDPALNGGSFFHYFNAGGTGSYFGNTCPVFSFNADDVCTSAVNLYGQGTNSQVRAIHLGASGVNKWTTKPKSASQTFEVTYVMSQGGADRVTWTEKWVYKGPRP